MHDAFHESHAVLHERYGTRLRHVVLYGSQSRGDTHSDSGVNVPVVIDEPMRRYEEMKRLVDVSTALFNHFGYLVSFKVMPTTDDEDPRHPLMIDVRREGVTL